MNRMAGLKIFLLTLCISLAAVLSVEIQLSDNCPATYNVHKTDGRDITIRVLSSKTFCDRVPRGQEKENHIIENDDLYPTIESVQKNDELLVNISWRATPDEDSTYPKKFLLYLTILDKTDGNFETTDKMCVLLKLGRRKANKTSEASRIFYYDCLKLVHKSTSFFTVQIWSLPDKLRNKSCLKRAKRSARYNACSRMECSEETDFPLSKEYHEYEMCECYVNHHGYPVLNWSKVKDTGQFIVVVTNLPPYSGDFEVSITDDYGNEYSKIIIAEDIQDGRFEFTTDRNGSFAPGNYTVLLYAGKNSACRVPQEIVGEFDGHIKEKCFRYPIHYGNQVIEVVEIDNPSMKMEYVILLCVLTGVILSCSVTAAVFVVRKCRSQQSKSEVSTSARRNNWSATQGTQEATLTSETSSFVVPEDAASEEMALLALANSSDKKMLLEHPDAKSAKLIQTLQENGIQLDSTNHSNWRDFAESAVDSYTEIVIILSEKFIELCHNYKIQSSNSALLVERAHENVPCVVLNKLRCKIQDDPNRRDFSLHIISPESGDLINRFLQDHDFLRRTSNCFCYSFDSSDLNSAEDVKTLYSLTCRLTGKPSTLEYISDHTAESSM